MLVATAGLQTAAYSSTLHNKSTSGNSGKHTTNPVSGSGGSYVDANRICRKVSSSTINLNTHIIQQKQQQSDTRRDSLSSLSLSACSVKIAESTNAAANALLKSLTVRLSRGTGFLKDTVQKALINTGKTATTLSASSSLNGIKFHQTKQTNLNGKFTISSSSSATSIAPTFSSTSHSGSSGAVLSASSSLSASTSSSLSSSIGTTKVQLAVKDKTQLSNTISKQIKPTKEFIKQYTIPPTVNHYNPEDNCNQSVNSIHLEHMCHFKPIRSAPTTPAKVSSRSRGIIMKTPKAKFPPYINVDFIVNDPTLFADLRRKPKQNEIKEKNDDNVIIYEYLKPKIETTTSLPTIFSPPKHRSAFVYMIPKTVKKFAFGSTIKQSEPIASSIRSLKKKKRAPTNKTKGGVKKIKSAEKRTAPTASSLRRMRIKIDSKKEILNNVDKNTSGQTRTNAVATNKPKKGSAAAATASATVTATSNLNQSTSNVGIKRRAGIQTVQTTNLKVPRSTSNISAGVDVTNLTKKQTTKQNESPSGSNMKKTRSKLDTTTERPRIGIQVVSPPVLKPTVVGFKNRKVIQKTKIDTQIPKGDNTKITSNIRLAPTTRNRLLTVPSATNAQGKPPRNASTNTIGRSTPPLTRARLRQQHISKLATAMP